MKNTYKHLFVVLITLITFSCSKEEVQNNESLSVEELTLELKNNIDFNEIVSKNAEFSSLLINKLKNSHLENKYSTQDDVNVNQFMADIGMADEYNQYIQDINQHIVKIKNKYSELNILSQDDMFSIFNELSNSNNIISNYAERNSNCDAQFQSDMQAIHNQYDTSVTLCTIATLLSGGLASPCYVAAVATAVFQTAVAIDRHTLCTQNQ